MAELRSFIIGVTIAGALLLFAGLAFGLFGDDSSGSPSVRLLGTPPATRTPPPATTRDPSELTPVLPTPQPPNGAASGDPTPNGAVPGDSTPDGETPGGETPASTQEAAPPTEAPTNAPEPTATLEIAPTQAPTPEPTEAPQVNEVAEYVDSANQYTPALVAQMEYLIGNLGAPSMADPSWRSFTLESAQNIQGLAGGLASIAAPACVSSAHGSLVAAANEASAAASGAIAAVEAQDAAAASTAAGNLSAARDAINSAVAGVSTAVGSC